ncbi:MAG: hypothetical protein M3R24_20390 [Chloroflexota bacterium]|nr:hypothetical protein [Chloroflexota bacterium]
MDSFTKRALRIVLVASTVLLALTWVGLPVESALHILGWGIAAIIGMAVLHYFGPADWRKKHVDHGWGTPETWLRTLKGDAIFFVVLLIGSCVLVPFVDVALITSFITDAGFIVAASILGYIISVLIRAARQE